MSLINSFRRVPTAPPPPPNQLQLQQHQLTPPPAPAPEDDFLEPRTSIRRPRSDSLEQENQPESLTFSRSAIKRHKTVAREVCQQKKLPVDALDEFAEVRDPI